MSNRIIKTTFVLMLAFMITLSYSSIFMTQSFADDLGNGGSSETIKTEAGDDNFDTLAKYNLKPNINRKINLIERDANGNWVNGRTVTEKEYLQQMSGYTEEKAAEVDNAALSVYQVNKDVAGKSKKKGYYPWDGTPKVADEFIDKSWSKSFQDFIRWQFEHLPNIADIKSGKMPMVMFYISKESLIEYFKANPKAKIPKELKKRIKELHVDGDIDKIRHPKPPKKPPKKPPTKKDPPPTKVGCDIGSGPKYKFNKTTSKNDEIKGDYSVMVSVIPQRPKNFGELTPYQRQEWIKTHHTQTQGPIKTPLGEYLDANRATLRELKAMGNDGGIGENSDYRKAWEKFAAGAKAAAAQPLPDPTITLSERNLQGNSRGAVFTYVQQVKTVSVSTIHKQDLYKEYKCVGEYYTKKTPYIDKDGKKKIKEERAYRTRYKKVDSKAKKDGNYAGKEVVAIEAGGYAPRTSHQTLTVRCNQGGFNSIVSSTGSTVIDSSTAAQAAKSPIVKNQVATFYNSLDKAFFYDGKSCTGIYGCTATPDGAANDRANNKKNTGNLVRPNSFGAQSDNKNASEFAIFRDNVAKEIRNDVWYPTKRSGTGMSYDGAPAVKTYLVMDKTGTPSTDFFEVQKQDGTPLITGKTFQNKWYVMLTGQENKFKWKSSWASDAGKPHKLNTLYGYKPVITGNVPNSYNSKGVTNTSKTSIIDLLCVTKYNTTNVADPIIVNGPKELTNETFSKFQNALDSYYKVNFVKSSAE